MSKQKGTTTITVNTPTKPELKPNYKISDEEFFDVLKANAGILARTARAIEKKYGISFSRQAVEDRAKRSPDKLNEIRAAAIDDAEEILISLMHTGSEKIRADIVKFYLKTQGKGRGYTERIEQYSTGEFMVKTVYVEHISTGIPLADSEKDVIK
ncbi:hypothetical protein [Mucilaginibacter sp. L196]|uniref:hypothetical protein n=1 Tax=Mucilaginibacter sp. L196 TaxID=1641870 RepID=UPI00131ECD03|nr:hypothetical protein [Mucilaginibacter sp. L196]